MTSSIPPGLRYMLAAAFFFSIMSLLVKAAGRTLPASEIVFARSAFSLAFTYLLVRRAGLRPWGRRKGLLVARGVFGFGGLLAFFHAVTRLPLADVTVIHYTNPVFTGILAALLLGERMGRHEVLGLLVSLAGVVLVARPTFLFGAETRALDLAAVGIALAGAFFASLAYTTVRKLGESEHHLVVVLYFPLVATPASLPLVFAQPVWPDLTGWALLLGVALATQIAQIYLTRGLHAERAGRAMSMSYVQILFAAGWGALFFDERPDPLGILGALLVVSGTLLVAGRSGRPRPAPPEGPAAPRFREPSP